MSPTSDPRARLGTEEGERTRTGRIAEFGTFDPQSGHEQRDRRPALVVSNTQFNENTGLEIVCPLTSQDWRFPFHVTVPDHLGVTGFVMVEQVKSIDYRARKARHIGTASIGVLEEVLSILDASIY